MKKFKKIILSLLVVSILFSSMAFAQENPYGNLGLTDCTWTAWQLAYDRLGIALPRWGCAGNWVSGAQASGYPTGTVPEANAIIVWSGHVGFVAQCSGNNIYVLEGGWDSSPNGYHEGWYDGTYGVGTNWGQAIIGYVYLGNIPANADGGGTFNSYSDSSRVVSQREKELQELQSKKDNLTTQIKETEKDIKELKTNIATNQELSDQIVRNMYMMGGDSVVGVLFQSESLVDFFTRYENVSKLMNYNKKIVNQLNSDLTSLEQKKEQLENDKAELEEIQI